MSAPDAHPENPWIQTRTGRALDLMAPTADMIDLEHDVAEALAKEPRFAGHTQGGPYSVAQHCVLGVDAILAQTGSLALARAFLLHDAHEAYCKDIMTPLAKALEDRVNQLISLNLQRGVKKQKEALLMLNISDIPTLYSTEAAEAITVMLEGVLLGAIYWQKYDLDRAIHAAAGADWPLAPDIAAKVTQWDLAMLQTERRHLLAPPPKPWAAAVEAAAPALLRGRITPWPWVKAADEWRARLHTLFPHLAARAA